MSLSQAQTLQPARAPATSLQRLGLVLCALPALWLGLAAAVGTLGANPLEKLLRVSGRTSLWLLLFTLATGPLLRLGAALAQWAQARQGRRLSDWNALVGLRRTCGLSAFFYAVLHTGLYLWLDAGFSLYAVGDDLGERHVVAGWLGLLLLLPLALTSTDAARRALGAHWPRLHLLGYAAALAGVAHFALQAKVAALLPVFEMLAVALLVGWRVQQTLRGRPEVLEDVRLRLRRWRR